MKKRIQLLMEFGNFMIDLAGITLTRTPYMIALGSVTLSIMAIIDVIILLPLNIIFNTVLLITYYLPFSPKSGYERIEYFKNLLKEEAELREQIKEYRGE